MPGRVRVGAALAAAAVLAAAGPGAGAELRLVEDRQELPGGGFLIGKNAVAVTPDGEHVYASGEAALAAFARGGPDGRLSAVDAFDTGAGNPPQAIAASPDGAHVYVSFFFGIVAAFRRAADGALEIVESETQDLGGSAAGLAVVPDGTQLLVATAGGLSVFARDAASGALEAAQRLEATGVAAIPGLAGATAVAASPDGRHVYVSALGGSEGGPGALVVLRREEPGHELAFVQEIAGGAAGVPALEIPVAVALAPDGGEVLALGQAAGALVRFARDADTGTLTFVDALAPESGGFPLLFLAAPWLAVRPDGARVYAASVGNLATAIFARDAASGALEYLESVDGAGLGGAASPDGANLYETGGLAVRVYAPEPGSAARVLGAAAALAAVGARRASGGRALARALRAPGSASARARTRR